MRRFLAPFLAAIGVALLLGSLVGLNTSRAQVSATGAWSMSKIPSAAGYTGPLDLGLPNIVDIWSLRCASTSYTGLVADIWDTATGSTTETLLTCSAGGIINQTINPLSTTCATSCNIKTLYSQIGASNCVGPVHCDLISPGGNALRPLFTTSCVNGKSCGACTASSGQLTNTALINSISQPYILSFFAERTANVTSRGTILSVNGTAQTGFDSVANKIFGYAGTVVNVTGNDSAFHSVQTTLSGASSEIDVDGTVTGSLSAGTAATGSAVIEGCAGGSNPLTGNFTEMILASGTWSSGQKSSLSANQAAYW